MKLPPDGRITGTMQVNEGPLAPYERCPMVSGQSMFHVLVDHATLELSILADGDIPPLNTYLGYYWPCPRGGSHGHWWPLSHRDRPKSWILAGMFCSVQPAMDPERGHGFHWTVVDGARTEGGWMFARVEAVRNANDVALARAEGRKTWSPESDGQGE